MEKKNISLTMGGFSYQARYEAEVGQPWKWKEGYKAKLGETWKTITEDQYLAELKKHNRL